MKRTISIIISMLILLQGSLIPANADTKVVPKEYDHPLIDSVKNNRLYFFGYHSRPHALLFRVAPLFDEDTYGLRDQNHLFDEAGRWQNPIGDGGFPVDIYQIKGNEKVLIHDYDTNWVSDSPWIKHLKPYTTYTFQAKIVYPDECMKYPDGSPKFWKMSDTHWSEPIKVRTCPEQTKIKSVKAAKHSATLRWKKVKCMGYKIQQAAKRSSDGSWKWKTVKTVDKSKTKTTVKALKSNKKYKFRVIPYGKVPDKRYPRALELNEKNGYTYIYSQNLFAKPSKAVTVKTKR